MDRNRLLDLIDRMRSAVPAEVESARAVLQDRNEVLKEAAEEAQLLVAKAREEADLRTHSHDLVLEAQRRASELMEQTTEQSRETLERARTESAAIRGDATSQAVEQAMEADRYSLDILQRLDSQLAALGTSVRAGINQLDQKLRRDEEQVSLDGRDAEIRRQHANQ